MKTGWKRMPTSFRILFILLIIGFISSLTSLFSIKKYGFPFLGFDIYGTTGVILSFIITTVGILLLIIAIWKRYSWGWNYSLFYIGYMVLNSLLSIISLPNKVTTMISTFPEGISYSANMLYFTSLIGIFISVAIYATFFIILQKNKKYFSN
jgi:hypothetical protein